MLAQEYYDKQTTILNDKHLEQCADSLLRAVPTDTSRVHTLQFDPNLAERYTDDAFDYSMSHGGKTIIQKIKEYIQNLLRKLLGLDKITSFNKLTKYFFYALLGLLFIAIVYIAVRLIMNHKGRWFFEKESQTVTIDLKNVETHIHEADFETLLHDTEQRGDTRQSIRLYYLWLLKNLTDKQIIDWHPEKTNADYMREISDEALGKQFRYLSYLFNHIWYGEFTIDDKEYQHARTAFRRELNKNDA